MKTKIVLGIALIIGTIYAPSQNKNHNTFEYSGPYEVFTNGNTLLESKKKKNNGNNSIKNEDLLLYQIDVDRDKSTFSSNAVSVNIPADAKIEKAFIIWACNYNFCFVNDTKGKKPIKTSSAKPNDGTIKFKAPFHDRYIKLKPEVLVNNTIYDNAENRYDPSVFNLDITEMLQGQDNVNGLYWLADYYTIQGQTLDGISSGWSIVIVYKTENTNNNFIHGSIGYKKISPKSTASVTFPNIKNNLEDHNSISYSLTMFFLGGDPNEGDEKLHWSHNTIKDIPINFDKRSSTGMLNGSIDNFGERRPKHKNNFGVDLFNVKNEIPSIFFKTSNIKEMTLNISTEQNNEEMQLIYSILEMPVIESIKSSEDIKAPIIEKEEPVIAYETDEKKTDNLGSNEDDIIVKSYQISNVEPGYYIINGVFSKLNNRKNWIKKLKSISNYEVGYFNNPSNGFDYIFCHFGKDLPKVKDFVFDMKKNKDFKESWVLEVQN